MWLQTIFLLGTSSKHFCFQIQFTSSTLPSVSSSFRRRLKQAYNLHYGYSSTMNTDSYWAFGLLKKELFGGEWNSNFLRGGGFFDVPGSSVWRFLTSFLFCFESNFSSLQITVCYVLRICLKTPYKLALNFSSVFAIQERLIRNFLFSKLDVVPANNLKPTYE